MGLPVATTDRCGRDVAHRSRRSRARHRLHGPHGSADAPSRGTGSTVSRVARTRSGEPTTWAYDPAGNLLSFTDSQGATTTYTYDDLQWLASRTDPLGRTETYDHDALGLLRSFTDATGQVTGFTWDPLARLARVAYGGSGMLGPFESTIDYTWDAGNRLLAADDSASGAIARSWDGLDRLVAETSAQGTVSYTYDAADRRTGMSVEGQAPTMYSWDDADRVTAVARGSDRVTMTRDAVGRTISTALPNGVTETRSYDADGAIARIATASPAGPLLDIAYVRALDERPTLVTGVPASLPEAVDSATYDASGQLRTWGERTFTYDPLGNELSDGIRTLTWDSRGQLTQVDGPIVAAYGYDAFGRRVATRVDDVGSDAVFDIQNVVRIVPADGSPTDVLGGLNLNSILATSSDGSTSAVLRDDLGTVLGLVGADGTATAIAAYEPYGGVDAGPCWRHRRARIRRPALGPYRPHRYACPGLRSRGRSLPEPRPRHLRRPRAWPAARSADGSGRSRQARTGGRPRHRRRRDHGCRGWSPRTGTLSLTRFR